MSSPGKLARSDFNGLLPVAAFGIGGGIGGMVGGKVSTAVGVLVLAWIAPHWEQAAEPHVAESIQVVAEWAFLGITSAVSGALTTVTAVLLRRWLSNTEGSK